MKTVAVSLLMLVASGVRAEDTSRKADRETVVLLHGLALRSWAMARIGQSLRAAGYRVVNLTYPSRTITLERLASDWLPGQLRAAQIPAGSRVNFVTHSMGGIIVRMYLRDVPGACAGRVVMLAPPNHGSEVADHLDRFAWFRWFTGVNGPRLGTRSGSVPSALGAWPPAGGQLGIIAGDTGANFIFSPWLGKPNDGRVAVRSAQLEGMSDFIVLHHSHTWLQWRADTIRQVRCFLRQGRFDHGPPTSDSPG